MPPITSTLYPRGAWQFEASFDDSLTGLPVRERHAVRDYRQRVRDRRDLDAIDRRELARDWPPRVEWPDVDP